MTSISALWERAEARQPDSPALVSGERVSYRQLGARIRLLADCLAARGLAPGGVCGLLAPNSVEFVAGYFAILQRGGVVQPLDPALTDLELQDRLSHSAAPVLLVHPDLADRARTLALQPAPVVVPMDRESGLGDPWTSPAIRESSQAAELVYTSGTVGSPRAVLRSHDNVLAAAGNAVAGFGYQRGDVVAISMPLSHSSALTSQLIPVLHLAGTAVLVDDTDPAAMLQRFRTEAVSCFRAPPATLRALLAEPGFSAEELPALRLIGNSSAPVDPATVAELRRRFPESRVINSYGLTEASTCTVLPHELGVSHPDSIGHPIKGVEMRIADGYGNPLADGRDGEVQVRGTHVFSGYYNQPQATAAAFTADGWLRTGDIGRRDADGLYYLRGRIEEAIESAGETYWPAEIESCLLELPELAEAAVVGVADGTRGQTGRAWVVSRSASFRDAGQVRSHCAARLPAHKVPAEIRFVSRLPRGRLGEVVRRALHQPDARPLLESA